MVDIPRRRPDRLAFGSHIVGLAVFLGVLLMLVTWALIPGRADAAQSDFIFTRVNGVVSIYLIKHKPTGTCFIATYQGGITQTKPEVCQ